MAKKKKKKQDIDILDEVVVEAILSKVSHEFEAVVGEKYYLYSRANGSYFVSLVEPEYWNKERFKLTFISNIIYTQGHSWETEERSKK